MLSFLLSLVILSTTTAGNYEEGQNSYLKNYSVKNGLSHNTVYQCISDSLGQMWFATNQGISRFDGKTFTNYTSLEGLEGNTIFGFHKDFEGRIWYYSFEGRIGYLENDKWSSIEANEELSNKYAGKVIGSMHVNRDGSILLGFKESRLPGIVKVESDRRTVTEMKSIDKRKFSFYKPFLKKNVWTIGGGNFKESWIFGESLKASLPYKGSLIYLESNQKSFVTVDKTLYEIRENRQEHLFESSSTIYDCYFDSQDQSYFIGTRKNGVIQILNGDKRKQFLEGHTVYHSFKDEEGGLWFCTEGKGVFYLSPDHVNHFPISLSSYQKILHQTDESIILSNDSSIAFYIKKQNNFTLKKQVRVPNLQRATYSNGSFFISDDVTTSVYSSNLSELLWKEKGYSFYAASTFKGTNYLGYFGLRMVDSLGNVLYNSKYDFDSRIFDLCIDDEKVLVGTGDGVWTLKDSTLRKIEIFQERTHSILKVSNGYLINQIGKGVIWWNGDIDSPKVSSISQSSYVRKMLKVSDSLIIAASSNGYEFLRRKENKWQSDQRYHYFSWFSSYSDISYFNNSLWLLREDGLFIKPIFSKERDSELSLFITEVYINNKRSLIEELSKGLTASQNNISLHFKSISYSNPKSISYRYRVNQSNWISTLNNELQLAGLSSGEYQVEVEALLGGVPKISKEVSFSILPPIWKRWWFILGVLIALLLLSYSAGRYLDKKKQAFLRLELSRQKAQLNAIQAQINPHFLFNVFNSIQQLVLNKETKDAIRGMSKFSKLMRNALNLSKHEFISIKSEIEFLKLYVDLENLRLEEEVTISFLIDKAIDEEIVMIPPMILQILVENSIWHGLQERGSGGEIAISFYKSNDLLITFIEDNGIGIQRSKEKRSQFGKQRSSRGMGLIKEKLEILEKQYKRKDLKLSYKEADKENEYPGTIVELKTTYREEY